MQIDHLTARLVREPGRFDVLLLPNLYGDIISDLCAGLVGGLGLIPGANIGWEYAVFEPVHGSAPDIAGQGVANPIAMILSGAMMLRHLGELDGASAVERAVDAVLEAGEVRTPDLGGSSSTMDVAAGDRGRAAALVGPRRWIPTGIRWESSAAGFAVVPATPLVRERLRSVAHRDGDTFERTEIRLRPVGEEVPDVLPEQMGERRHAVMLVPACATSRSLRRCRRRAT